MWTLQARRRPSVCLLLVGGLVLVGCRDEERPTQPNQPCCGQCGYDEYSVCRRCGYMDICDSPIMEGGPCDLPKLDGYCHCGDDPDCTYTPDGQRIDEEQPDQCDAALAGAIYSPGPSKYGTFVYQLYFADSPACKAGDPR